MASVSKETTQLVANGYAIQYPSTMHGQSIGTATKNGVLYTVKQANKNTTNRNESALYQCDAVKQSRLLHFCTVLNASIGGYVARFIDFFETEDSYFLITEYAGNMTLAAFHRRAQQHIAKGHFTRSEYKKVVKFIAWQICVTLKWLHAMSISHLTLSLESIMVRDEAFILQPDGSVHLNRAVNIKVHAFENAIRYVEQSSPDFLAAQKEDVWQFGCLLFELYSHQSLYQTKKDSGFIAVSLGKLDEFAKMNNLGSHFSAPAFRVLLGALQCDERNRSSVDQMLRSPFFAAYYRAYGARIQRQIAAAQQAN